jgi:hypothetical protein
MPTTVVTPSTVESVLLTATRLIGRSAKICGSINSARSTTSCRATLSARSSRTSAWSAMMDGRRAPRTPSSTSSSISRGGNPATVAGRAAT